MSFCGYCGKKLEDGVICDCSRVNEIKVEHTASPVIPGQNIQQSTPVSPPVQPAHSVQQRSKVPSPVPPVQNVQEERRMPEMQSRQGNTYESQYQQSNMNRYAYTAQQAVIQQSSQISVMLKGLTNQCVGLFKNFFISQEHILEQMTKTPEVKAGLFFYCLKALIMALIVTISLALNVNSFLGKFKGGISFGDCMGILFRVLLFSLIADAVFFGVTYVAGKLFKSGVTPNILFSVLGIASIPVTCAFAVGGILSIISLKIGIGVLLIILLYSIFVGYNAVDISLKLKSDKIAYIYTIIIIVLLILTYFVLNEKFGSIMGRLF